MGDLNEHLKEALEQHFKHLGIVAYSGCCRWGCTGSYDESDDDFRVKQKGVFYIRLHLSGMNYSPRPQICYANYEDFEYLKDHWKEEKDLLAQWCMILGLKEGEFTISQPPSGNVGVKIEFAQPLDLDPIPDYDEDDE
eukprot:CAMPEP_0201481780 /NCGR_PEP_ID=MMETSP0151_2-20130828/6051_1 /ASSEMBLY_ACC=CAM_ASM_000257 /TAXON_ID=200890 /ORGANISM="Paramoeba atlantica, Strain 621/1 / CCAP 1560/9" /LENGTH=137 /DNA_ID=CAMNT_0047864143 /DNA_START=96 /DNA_END=509 /DNA_ORIENTATION=+